MYEQTNTMMENKTSFQIPQLLDGDDFTSEDLADDMEGLRLSFTRIKIPGGGHLQFEIPSGNPDVPDYPRLRGWLRGADQGHQRAESTGGCRGLQRHRGRRCLAPGIA